MMRLTLRTLLAYLDDVLEPADTKIMGQKIQESPMAQLLVSRIREVMRRRRLKAPELVGPEMGLDPNIVSQYLDSTLQPEKYADVERVLLASDEMLAEVAACHQILTILFAEPTDVSPSSRERLYALGPVDAGSQLKVTNNVTEQVSKRTPHSVSTRNGAPISDGPGHGVSLQDDERITTVPDYLKPAPWPQRFLPTAVVAVLIVICVVVLGPDLMNGFQRMNSEIKRKSRNVETAQAPEGGLADARDSNVDVASIQNASSESPATNGRKTGTSFPEGFDPNPPEDETEDIVLNRKPEMKDVDSVPFAASPEKPPKVDSTSKGPLPAKPVPIPPEAMTELLVAYSSNEGVIARLDEDQSHWLVVPHQTVLKPDEIVANFEPFDSILEFEKANVRATLVGESYVKILNPATTGIQGLGIGRGRILLQSHRHTEKQIATFGIAIGEDVWNLEMQSSDTVCVLEVNARESTQYQKLNDYYWYQALVYVVSGSAKWTNREGSSQEITDHMALNIIPEKVATVRSQPIAFQSAPEWCDSVKRKAFPLRRYQTVFEKTFDAKQPVDQSMLTLVKSVKNPKIAELAARCLSAMDNYSGLVETLAECQHEEARFAARDGLRIWLPMSPEHGPWLMAKLELHYTPEEAAAIYRMLWGFSREDVKDSRAAAGLLMSCLRSQRLEIRELGDYWVKRLTGRKSEFRASAPPNHREPQVRRLEEQIERDNGLIKGP